MAPVVTNADAYARSLQNLQGLFQGAFGGGGAIAGERARVERDKIVQATALDRQQFEFRQAADAAAARVRAMYTNPANFQNPESLLPMAAEFIRPDMQGQITSPDISPFVETGMTVNPNIFPNREAMSIAMAGNGASWGATPTGTAEGYKAAESQAITEKLLGMLGPTKGSTDSTGKPMQLSTEDEINLAREEIANALSSGDLAGKKGMPPEERAALEAAAVADMQERGSILGGADYVNRHTGVRAGDPGGGWFGLTAGDPEQFYDPTAPDPVDTSQIDRQRAVMEMLKERGVDTGRLEGLLPDSAATSQAGTVSPDLANLTNVQLDPRTKTWWGLQNGQWIQLNNLGPQLEGRVFDYAGGGYSSLRFQDGRLVPE